ncbi:hypothetical protein [Agarilytica rhodophyticola]|uniref:hypothetical protein n=1 Tax=Agarilytica rhodophyticola TaxID=1737490 RepID=UPI000B348E39|nr:hypothetical protein [Agarilytica rhodophyticola]
MGMQIKIFLVCVAAHYGSYFLLSRLTPFDKELKKYFIASVVITVSSCLLKMLLLSYIAAFIMCLRFTRGEDASYKICLLLGIAFVMPNDAGFFVNPGINLGELNYFKVLVFGLIIPILFKEKKDPSTRKFNLIDYAAIFFIIWQFFLNFGFGNFTGTLRANLWLVVEYLLPYLVIRFYLRNYLLAFAAISFALIAQMFVSIAEGLLSWKLYESFKQVAGFENFIYSMYKYRHGFLRAEAVYGNPLVLSLFGNFAFLCAYLVFKKSGFEAPKSYSKLLAWGLLFVAIGGTFFTGSRAGMAGIGMMWFLYFAFGKGIEMKRDPKNKFLIAVVVGLGIFLATGQDFIKSNFGYRYKLIEVSQGVIADNFIAGNFNALDDPRMEVLRQGEGIIDVVNSYVYFALHYGMFAMIALMIAFIGGMIKTYTALRSASGEKYTLGMFMLCSLAVLSFNLATTSPLGWSYQWIWVILSICSNIVAKVDAEKREANKVSLF